MNRRAGHVSSQSFLICFQFCGARALHSFAWQKRFATLDDESEARRLGNFLCALPPLALVPRSCEARAQGPLSTTGFGDC
jgi:hypothetical protein